MARLLLTLLLICTLYMVVSLKITSLNIRRGFRNKIDDILANYGDGDLICLQECCHMDTNLVEYLEKINNYKFYISQGDTNTKGVVIIVNKNIENVNCHIIPQFLNGRLNHISIKLDKCVLHVLNIYGPAQQDERVNFYYHLNEYCRSINNNTDKYTGRGVVLAKKQFSPTVSFSASAREFSSDFFPIIKGRRSNPSY